MSNDCAVGTSPREVTHADRQTARHSLLGHHSPSRIRPYLNRRRFLRDSRHRRGGREPPLGAERLAEVVSPRIAALAGTKLETVKSPLTTTGEELTSFEDITHYNNFYEFGVEKDQPAKNAGSLPTRPWTVRVEGKVEKPKTFDIDALLKLRPLEDRVYRHRCVEAWSMVIPWVGYSLSEFIKQCEPLPQRKIRSVPLLLRQESGEVGSRVDNLLAILRRPAHGRGHAPAGAADLWLVWRGAAQPGWRAGAHRGAVEVWLQVRQVDCGRALPRQAAAHYMERPGTPANTASTPT